MTVVADYPGLIPFEKGHDPRRATGRGRPSILNDPEQLDLVAKAMADGMTTKLLAETFNVTPRTIHGWKKDPRIKASALKYVEDRILAVTRKTDATLDALVRSEAFGALTVEKQFDLLLKLRKEMLGGVLRMQAESGKVDAGDINSTMQALEDDPTFAQELQDFLERTGG